jgi:hypothetical protein
MIGAATKEWRTNETYYKSCVIADLLFVTINNWELTDKLRRALLRIYVMGIDERTWLM